MQMFFGLKMQQTVGRGERDKREGETEKVIVFFYCKLN